MRFTRVALSPDPDLAVAALMIARLEYPAPRRGALHRRTRRDGPRGGGPRRGGAARRRDAARRRSRSATRGHRTERLPVPGTAVRRQHDPLRGPAQHLPERSARSPHRDPDHPGAGLHGGGAARRHHASRASTSRATSWCAARCGAGQYQRPDHRRIPRRGAALRRRLPAAAAAARRRRRGVGRRAFAGARDQAADPGADAASI